MTTEISNKANRTVLPIIAAILFTLFIAFQIAAMFKLI